MKQYRTYVVAVSIAAIALFGVTGLVMAATNISSGAAEHWAWNDILGWINFYDTDTVVVSSQKLTGYASSSAGDISLDCATTSVGDICSTSNYSVLNNGVGSLSGWGWNDAVGWVSFCGGQETSDCPGTVGYRVLINPDNGKFTDYAWNDAVGWISFNCTDLGICGSSQYDVTTSWTATSTSGSVESGTFDTGIAGGAQINSILWHGSLPSGTEVRFELAVSASSTGPWVYDALDSVGNPYYAPVPDVSSPVNYVLHNNARYFRYRMILVSNEAQTASPRVDEVIVNWSP